MPPDPMEHTPQPNVYLGKKLFGWQVADGQWDAADTGPVSTLAWPLRPSTCQHSVTSRAVA